ncbi:MAG: pyridoxal-phosphate dependent enzyme, partial [Phycisphaerae bacterium]|nr:pyridoxal-phosphate dependent enzyme [Phycisphaerae bacterium]
MSFVTKLTCVACGAEYPEGETFTCPDCGVDEGILDVQFDLAAIKRTLTRAILAGRDRSHWRYRELLPLEDECCPRSGSIGWTPLIEAPRLAEVVGVDRLRLKDDGRSASGSFKDRASSVGVARAIQEGYTSIACASTGNAASSLAHCAAAAGLQANIFVSRIIPEGK